jgi:hypothetical protein
MMKNIENRIRQAVGYFPDNLLHGAGESFKRLWQFKDGVVQAGSIHDLTTMFVKKMLGVRNDHPKYWDPKFLLERSYQLKLASESLDTDDPQLSLNRALVNVPPDERAIILKCFDQLQKQLLHSHSKSSQSTGQPTHPVSEMVVNAVDPVIANAATDPHSELHQSFPGQSPPASAFTTGMKHPLDLLEELPPANSLPGVAGGSNTALPTVMVIFLQQSSSSLGILL